NLLKEEGKLLKQQGKKRLDSTEYSFILTSSLLPEADPFNLRMEEACTQLATQYFRGEAPARIRDFAWWAGINVTDAIRGAAEVADKPFSRWKGKLINDPLATIIFNGRVVGVWEWNEDDEEVDLLLFDSSIPKSVEKAIQKRAVELANFIRANLGEVRLQGSD